MNHKLFFRAVCVCCAALFTLGLGSVLPSAALSSVAPSTEVVLSSAAEGAVDGEGNRLLAGADRYATAVLLAEVPLDAGDAGTGDVLVVSGESLVDAVSAVSVAASRDAVVVLTEGDRLPAAVRELLSARGFEKATIGGGTNAVSAAVDDELAGLVADEGDRSSGSADDRSGDANAEAERIQGPTRYYTAVEAAEEAGDPGSWCDTGDTTAVLVNGQSLVDGVIAAPVAYAWALPLLFTEPGVLPDVVADYLRDANIERVVAVGSTNDIGAAVTDALEGLGVEVTRIDGRTPAARSVELVEAIEGCATQPVAPGEYALLDANQPVDGVAAAAALATGLGEHSASDDLIPVLAVNQNSLPQVVADYLADAGERHDTVTLYPLGGDARLTPQVISRAVAAAEGEAPDDDLTDDAAVDTRDLTERLVAAGLTVGESDGSGVAVGVGVVVEDGVIKLVPPAGRVLTEHFPGGHEQYGHLKAVDAEPIAGDWFGRPGVLDPYLWQPEIPVLEAGVDHDGDGVLSADEKYPLGSAERAEYMAASGGDAPPGATVLVVPDMIARNLSEEYRDTSVRYPVGVPVPPGAPDRSTTTFEQRDAERAQRFEAYSGGKSFGRWGYHVGSLCERLGNGGGPAGVPGSTNGPAGPSCETLADWYLWMCDVRNSPEVDALGPVEGWLATFDRFYEQWTSQMPATWMFQQGLEDGRVSQKWSDEVNFGQPLCTSNDDPANAASAANIAAHEARMAEITAWTAAPTTIIAHSHGPDGFTSASGRMLALRDVSESKWLRNVINEGCYTDIRFCSTTGINMIWGLRAFE